ncbi:MAG: hypothetical protein DSM107014_03170 [Gomphosphaeria aponina SAG 52.96 = DSM 107014]|uniref:Ig-like domain-containing protein n=1 Tax=Gomphosphaeria aponina SAG 52.96 = DSM 107014 TaxID=1521640 RepID=A0A941GMK9_9CHRO|nr:hypothetical protein [Gomphosphaeria aponina SAG 52.96 = DSM 107014]
MKYLTFLLLIIISLAFVSPVQASLCRQYNDNLICILSIKRSAKYYWEYRASVRINGVTRPIEIYNCREKVRIKSDQTIVPFAPEGAGEFICSYFQK